MGRRNVGGLDRAVRLAIGIVLLPVGLLMLDGLRGGLVGVVLATAGFAGLASGVSGFCLLYRSVGFSTTRQTRPSPSFR